MHPSEVSAAKIGVVFLLSVIGKRLTWNLASGDAASVAEGCNEESINSGIMLQAIQNRSYTLVDKRHRTYLNSNHASGSIRPEGKGYAGPSRRGQLREFTSSDRSHDCSWFSLSTGQSV